MTNHRDRASLQYQSLSNAEVMARIDAHQRWIETAGEEGQPAHFEYIDLSGRDFSGKNLQGVVMRRCCLQGSRFVRAVLDNADLSGSNLEGADFSAAVFADANLKDTCFINRSLLTEADLSGARGLNCEQFSGADLTGAKLPEPIACFDKLRYVNDVGQIARPIYLFLMLLAVFSFLTIVSTTDAALIANAPSAVLPNLATQIPAASLFSVGPALLIFMFIYLHLYLLGVWEALSELPARFPDGTTLEKKANPWLIISLVRLRTDRSWRKQPAVVVFRELVVVFLVWGVVPLALLLFWWRYLARHDLLGSLVQVVLFLVSLWMAITLFRIAIGALRGEALHIDRSRAGRLAVMLLAVGLVMGALSFAIIRYPLELVFWGAKKDPEHATLFVANVDGAEFSTKQSGWNGSNIDGVKGASLRHADLRNAFGQYAFLVNADLRKATLSGADIYQGDFRAANMEKARLNGANLDVADFSEACLRKAEFRSADLEDAIFDNAYLGKADLSGAELLNATLVNTYLQGALLAGADLESANFTGAVLTCWQKGDRIAERKCADLSKASMQATDFSHTDLRFAILANVHAPSARFLHAQIQATAFPGADLTGANFQGATAGCLNRISAEPDASGDDRMCTDFRGARLHGTDLSGADLAEAEGLTREALQQACGDEHTRLPAGLKVPPCSGERRVGHVHQEITPPLTKDATHNPCWQNISQDMWPVSGRML
jgi:uncharacterized protein YjbI with pentapeptide repeats